MHVTAIVAAGGTGRRFGGDVPKQLVTIDGRSILERSAALFLSHPAVSELIVALPADLVRNPPQLLRHASKPLRLVEGGPRRQDSVVNAFKAASRAAKQAAKGKHPKVSDDCAGAIGRSADDVANGL